MPRIFDNIDAKLHPALEDTLKRSYRADFCVGYFNLRGWKLIDHLIDQWEGGDGTCCRLMVGMQKLPHDELRTAIRLVPDEGIDGSTARRLKRRMAEEFREQLIVGAPSNVDEAGLRRLSAQLRARKVIVKLFLQHPLHAKLYLLFRTDPISPTVGYLGSSNLTMAGLSGQGELNVDVLDSDACKKLERWFDDRWEDGYCLDISDELADVIDTSWARETTVLPYHIYLKMAYHLCQEARTGLAEFAIPRDLKNRLFEFQAAAVKIAAHHVNKRNGVLLGDVVGLGKTLMATTLARIFEEDYGLSTLIICPPKLITMWQSYVDQYGLRARVISLGSVVHDLPNVPARFRLVIIDESHNLRNREGKRYRAIQQYITQSDSKCIELSATPYNKTYGDLSAQLRLFVPEHQELGIRPEKLLAEIGETEFIRRHQAPVRSLAAFEQSAYPDDWRDLMRLYMVRRTRSFIRDNYAETDPLTGRRYLRLEDGSLSYFPTRVPRTVPFTIADGDATDQYARLYAQDVLDRINKLALPRYGLGNYLIERPSVIPTDGEERACTGLSRAGKRLMGFCRTNLFKRLESGGPAFIQSIDRHILRNYIVLHAIENGLPIPVGTQDAELLDPAVNDDDDLIDPLPVDDESDEDDGTEPAATTPISTVPDYAARAAQVYEAYATQYRKRFKWLRPALFNISKLKRELRRDAASLREVLASCGTWNASRDAKLTALVRLLTEVHPDEKVLVFTQFADTARYVTDQLTSRGLTALAYATGQSADPTGLAWRFSPVSNDKRTVVTPDRELRVLITTDVLSEGQNLQDCAIVVNYDLPWAIIRLIQRAGRVDRIGQRSDTIVCYTFLPADGVERIIQLRRTVSQRLKENAEVVGTDEVFFDDETNESPILDLYNEKANILDGDDDTEVDLASYAYQIWKNATDADPSLLKTIPALPPVVYSTRSYVGTSGEPQGVLLYMRTAQGNDALGWINREGKSVTQSHLTILHQAECAPNTPAIPRNEAHHDLVRCGIEHIVAEEQNVGGQLGRPSGARFRTYERLKRHAKDLEGTLFADLSETVELGRAIEEIYRYPLQQTAVDALNRQLKSGADDDALAQLVLGLRAENRLCLISDAEEQMEPQVICSLGLFPPNA